MRRLEAEQALADELADRVVVAALLDEDGRQTEPAEERAGLAEAVRRHLERALRVVRRGIDSERDDQSRGSLLTCPVHECLDGLEPLVVARARREREVPARAR